MLEGLYSAAAGMTAQQRRLDAVANDISNVNTTGYKRLRVGFRDLLYQEAGRGAAEGIQTGAGARADQIGRGWGQGALRTTGGTLDIALSGPGFIRVRGPEGVALTRDGSLGVTPDGRLRTSTGALLDPPIKLPKGTNADDVAIRSDGVVTAKGRRVGQIQLVNVTNPDGMRALGNSLSAPTAESGAMTRSRDTRIDQGVLEASNVDLGDAMVDMINSQRAYELASKAIQMQDEMAGVANGVKQ